jgi:DNA-binding transcriptional MocR family regulator
VTDEFDFESLLSEEARHRAAPGLMVSASGAPSDIIADLLVGQPAEESLPLQAMVEAAQETLPGKPEMLLYGRRQGSLDLIEIVREKLRILEGLTVDPEQIIITNGSGQGLDLALRTFANRDQVVALDEASFGALFVRRVSNHGLHIPWDAEGPRPDELEKAVSQERPSLFYTIPTFQNPMGQTTTSRRRYELLEVCRRHRIPILEDDAYYELHYDGDRPPSMYELDGGSGMVIRAGTFSKILGAGIRLGWILTSSSLADRILPLKSDGGTSPFSSALATHFMQKHMEKHIAELQSIYRNRRDVMIEALNTHVGQNATWDTPNGGFFVWITLNKPELVSNVVERCRTQGVLVRSGAVFRIDGADLGSIRLAFSHATHDEIRAGVEILGQAIKESQASTQ